MHEIVRLVPPSTRLGLLSLSLCVVCVKVPGFYVFSGQGSLDRRPVSAIVIAHSRLLEKEQADLWELRT